MNRMVNLSEQSDLPSHERAIDILQNLKHELGSSALAYFITPNTILTLSGARAFCDNGFDSEDTSQLSTWLQEIKRGLTVLAKLEDLPYTNSDVHETPGGRKVASYSLISRRGLSTSLTQTNLINRNRAYPPAGKLTGINLMESLRKGLRKNPLLEDFKSSDIDAVGFGILLGYPDNAIVDGMRLWAENRDNELVDARIQYADFYDCPQPVYSYPRELMNNKQIVQHEKMWSQLLKSFYESDFHKQLATDRDFQNKIRELNLKK